MCTSFFFFFRFLCHHGELPDTVIRGQAPASVYPETLLTQDVSLISAVTVSLRSSPGDVFART